MSDRFDSTVDHYGPRFYEVRIMGHLDDYWTKWFDGLIITRIENGETLLSGLVTDQAALHGLLRKIRDLGLVLISVNRLKPDQEDQSVDKI